MRESLWIGIALIFFCTISGCAQAPKPPASPDIGNHLPCAEPGPQPSSACSAPKESAQTEPVAEKPSHCRIEAMSGAAPHARDFERLPTQKVSLRMFNADTAVVLRALARSVGLNILLNEKVHGTVSVDLENVPWNKAFIGILHSEELDYAWEGNMLRILTAEDMANQAKMQNTQPMQVEVIPIHYADPAKLAAKLKEIFSKEKKGNADGYVTFDEHTSSLVLEAKPETLREMSELARALDIPTAEINIVSNIVECTKEAVLALGIQWGGFYNSGRTFVTPGGTSGTTSNGQLTYTPLQGVSGISGQGFGVNLPASNLASLGGGSLGLMYGVLGGNILDVQLSALENEGKVKILSSPSLTTLDNQTAYTTDGQSVPVAQLTTLGEASVTYIDAVLKLEITPHIISPNILKLDILVKKDEPDFTQTVQGNPLIQRKETKTELICANGETVVISGLSLLSKSVTNANVPFFDKVPLLGALFKSTNDQDQFQDVLIFLTPHILEGCKEKIKCPHP
jgi:type IV pilus assembly protein PilQ